MGCLVLSVVGGLLIGLCVFVVSRRLSDWAHGGREDKWGV